MEHPIFNLDTSFRLLGLNEKQLVFFMLCCLMFGVIGLRTSGLFGALVTTGVLGGSVFVIFRAFNAIAFAGILTCLIGWLIQPLRYELKRDTQQVPLTLETSDK
jgi:hypothetical protein